MKRYIAALVIGLMLTSAGGLFLLNMVRDQRASIVATPPSTNQHTSVAASNIIQGYPSELLIPSLNIDLSVIPGEYNPKTKQWTLTLDKAQYAVMTPMPNSQSGNTFIYGHYRKEVFASLHTIRAGETAIVKTTNGHTFYYQLSSIRTTDPGDGSVFSYQGSPILTIQTCTGVFFQNRQLFTFNLVKVV